MKKQLTIIALVAFGLCSSHTAMAQPQKGDSYVNIFYSYAIPTGDFKNSFINRNSPLGAAVETMRYVNENLALGISFGFQDFYQKESRDLYVLSDGSDISAVRSRSVQTMPILLKANYFPLKMKPAPIRQFGSPKPKNEFQALPYASLGLGPNLVWYQQLLGIFTNAEDFKFAFAAQAGLGVKVPFGSTLQNGLVLDGNYNLMPFNQFVMNNVNHFNFRLGLQFEIQ
jgi:hypothetical protein